jgi:hypothetical protein
MTEAARLALRRLTGGALLAALAVLGSSGAAQAQSAADRADARCVLVTSLAAQNPAQRETAVRGQFHYVGRVMARGSTAKLGAMMVAEAKLVKTPQQLQTELSRCTAELTAANAALRAALKQVEQAARDLPKPAAPPK